jgi:hypothetical protein
MAEIVPDEGLDYLLNVALKGGTPPANTYLGLFTSQTPSTVPAAGMVLATPSGITEAAFTSYARQAIAAASWGATGAKTIWSQSARGTTAGQVSMPAAGAAYATAINGFFIASAASAGVCLLASNFDDTTAIASLALGDIVRVTPTYGLLN